MGIREFTNMLKKCSKCGKEEPFDYYADVEGAHFVCDYCIRKEQERIQSEYRERYHREKIYEVKSKKKDFLTGVFVVGLICIVIFFIYVIQYLGDQWKEELEDRKWEEERSQLSEYDIPITGSDTYEIDYLLFRVDDYNLINFYKDSEVDGIATYIENDQSATLKIKQETGELQSLEVSVISDKWQFGGNSLEGSGNDLIEYLIDMGAVYNSSKGFYDYQYGGPHYKIFVLLDSDDNIDKLVVKRM